MSSSGENASAVSKLFPRLLDITDPAMRASVARVWKSVCDDGDWQRVSAQPWSTKFGEGIITRNVEHVNQVVECALALASFAETILAIPVNRNILISAGLLLDADKLIVSTDKKDAHKTLVPHAFMSAAKALEEELGLEVVHAILAHSKSSNIPPRTIEALILHYSDYITADLRLRHAGVDHVFAAEAPKFAESRR